MTKIEFEIEFEGIYNTIKNYTNDHYILGYIDGLRSSLKEDDNFKTSLLINKLVLWYNDIMSELEKDQYVYNKDQHKKTLNLLTIFQETIKSQQQH